MEDGRGLVKCPSHPHLHPEHKVPEDRDSACLVHGCILGACSWPAVLSKFWLRNSQQTKASMEAEAPLAGSQGEEVSLGGPQAHLHLASYFGPCVVLVDTSVSVLNDVWHGGAQCGGHASVPGAGDGLGPLWHLYHRHGDCAAPTCSFS